MGRPKLPFERFWFYVDKNGPVPERFPELGPCWIWKGARLKPDRYGVYKGKRVHRTSYELVNGPIQHGLECLHKCDVPYCLNPSHLWAGTHEQNMKDKVDKGRQSRGEKHSATMRRVVPRGSRHPLSPFSNDQVLSIRARYQFGVTGSGAHVLAKEFGVTKHCILMIVKRQTWTHI